MRKVLVKELWLQKELVEKVSGTSTRLLSGRGGWCCWGERLRLGAKSRQGRRRRSQMVPSCGLGLLCRGAFSATRRVGSRFPAPLSGVNGYILPC